VRAVGAQNDVQLKEDAVKSARAGYRDPRDEGRRLLGDELGRLGQLRDGAGLDVDGVGGGAHVFDALDPVRQLDHDARTVGKRDHRDANESGVRGANGVR
jgi:hypothetical protein